jgi:hypothetical protein
MPRWFSLNDFLSMEEVFRYHLTETQWEDLKRHFTAHQEMHRK